MKKIKNHGYGSFDEAIESLINEEVERRIQDKFFFDHTNACSQIYEKMKKILGKKYTASVIKELYIESYKDGGVSPKYGSKKIVPETLFDIGDVVFDIPNGGLFRL